MTQFDRFERELPLALRDVAGPHSPDYLTDILGRTAHTRQRPAWASLERWLPMDLASPRAATARVPWRALGALALIALLIVAAAALYAGSRHRVPAPFGPARNGLIPFDRNGDIYVGDPVAGTSRLIVGGPDFDSSAGFSPDGTRVSFSRKTPGGDQLMVADADGSNVRAVSAAPLENAMAIVWLPTSDGLMVDHGVGGSQRLEILGIDGGQPRVLAEDLPVDNIDFRPPNGGEVLVRATVGGATGLYSMRVDGTDRRLLATGLAPGGPDSQDLNWALYSADGRHITYNRYVPPNGSTPEAVQVWTMNADGSDQHRFNRDGPTGSWEGEAAPSPDGKWLAAWRSTPGGGGYFEVFAADGSGGPVVVSTAGGNYAWSPDSTKLVVNPDDTTLGGEQLVDAAGGPVVTLPWNENSEPGWQRLVP